MKVVLISPYGDTVSFGVRSLSASLKKAGHDVRIVFLPLDMKLVRYDAPYSDRALADLAEICRDAELIGISLMSNFFDLARRLSESLRATVSAPIVWGGIHPTICPEECLEYADIVCQGEAEEALVELVTKLEAGEDHTGTRSFWFRDESGGVIRNDVRPLTQDLDTLPFADMGLDGHYVLDGDSIKPMDLGLLEMNMRRDTLVPNAIAYQTMTSRGCPHDCTYCCNHFLRRLYSDSGKYVRRRSNDSIFEELAAVRKALGFVNYVWICDDCFLATSDRKIQEFSQRYKAEVDLPFACLVSPYTVSEPKIAALVDAGMNDIQMGIQASSERMLKIYQRDKINAKVRESAAILNKFRDRLPPPKYDFILDNPYETTDDYIATFKLLLDLPRPYCLNLFSMLFYPGMKLHADAERDGMVKDRVASYRKRFDQKRTVYVNVVFGMFNLGFVPRPLLRLLASTPVVKAMSGRTGSAIVKFVWGVVRKRRAGSQRARGKKSNRASRVTHE
jgi:radical SAM superfamily enzyme YgiQ (UPF0313 family)